MKHTYPFVLFLVTLIVGVQITQAQTTQPRVTSIQITIHQEHGPDTPLIVNQYAKGGNPATPSLSDVSSCTAELVFPSVYRPVICAGAKISQGVLIGGFIYAYATGECYAGDLPYVLELSDASGGFDNPLVMGSGPFVSAAFGFLANTLPSTLPYGTGYRFRYRVTDPTIVANIVITPPFTVGFPTSVFTSPTPEGLVVQLTGGVSYERLTLLEQINGYQIRGTELNTTGYFVITQPGQYTITAIGVNGCRQEVTGTN